VEDATIVIAVRIKPMVEENLLANCVLFVKRKMMPRKAAVPRRIEVM
jgi:hypothetical protein